MAFQIARGVKPEAELIFNDTLNHVSTPIPHSIWNVSQAAQTQSTCKIVNRLKIKGLVDAVGLQMHLDGANPPNFQDVIATMQSYGVPVEITEFDVNMRNVSGTQNERLAKQAGIYADALDACLASGVCRGFNVWDTGDKYSYAERPEFKGSSLADPTPFDDNLEPKLAYSAMLQIMQKYYPKQNPNTAATPTSNK